MRFVWLKKNGHIASTSKPGAAYGLIRLIYNAVWWLPILLVLTGTIDYGAGFIGFFAVTVVRLIANLYRNNVLSLEQAETFPFRS
ncbi:MAG: hypothetical protein KC519_05500 [Anaerolineae bacterium]|nr:hypothetical protein [Anaerolineae bacterium]